MDYKGPGSRIWIAWSPGDVVVVVLVVDCQYMHCRVTNRLEYTICLTIVIYGVND
ncbi:UNVERIFIED_CONTAM: hypothetical protein Slati_2489100 [Sesamum latifolium]|uniref:Uncharacterized protein n=1 Tax=Sesamum latifolium TaxID=2727402 RepID=A0AAW2WFN3_9LAMI